MKSAVNTDMKRERKIFVFRSGGGERVVFGPLHRSGSFISMEGTLPVFATTPEGSVSDPDPH